MAAPKVVKLQTSSALDKLVEDYLAHCRAGGLSPKTIRFSYGYPLRSVFLPWCAENGITQVSEVTNRKLDGLSTGLLEHGNKHAHLTNQTVWTYMKAINRFLAWAKDEGEDVDAKGRLPRLPSKVIEILTRDEIQAMEDKANSERDAIIVRLLGDTGIRVGELVSIQTNDLIDRNRQFLLRIKGKGSRERLVPVLPALYRRIERYAKTKRPTDASGNWLFVSSRRSPDGSYQSLTENGVQQLIRDLAERAGIKRRVHPHLFRHSAATYYLQRGMDSLLVAQMLGHTSLAMIQRVYAHLNTTDVHGALLRALTEEK